MKNEDGIEEPDRPHPKGVGIYVTVEHGHVVLNFEKPINFITMTPNDAVAVGRELLSRAKAARKGGGRIVEA